MEKVTTMKKKILGFAMLGLALSVPAHAQRSMSAALGPSGGGAVGGASGGGGSAGGATGGTVAFHALPAVASTQFQMISVSGTAGFVPSSWTQFEAGLAEGRAQMAAPRKSLGEVAAEYRHLEKPKARLAFVQDRFGKALIESR